MMDTRPDARNAKPGLAGRRIAFFHPYFNDGGIERGMLILAEKFSSKGVSTDIVSFRAGSAFRERLPEGCRFLDLGARRAFLSVLPLACYLKADRPDCLVSAQSYANLVAVAANLLAGRKARLVVTERVAISMERGRYARRMGFGGTKDRVILALMKAMYPLSDVVAANSRDGAADLQALLSSAKVDVRVLHNPTFDRHRIARSSEPVDHPWFNPKERPVIAAVGRLSPQKDFPTLLKAFARVHARVPCRLLILGEGLERGALEAQARALGLRDAIDFPGFCENPYKYVRRADMFVLSSLYEGLPNALIEALAVGTPSISTDCLSGPKEILLDGRGGTLVPVGDDARMAEAMLAYLSDPARARSMARTAQDALGRFESGSVAEDYLQVCL